MNEPQAVLILNLQGPPEPFGLCYECAAGRHPHCIGVPCDCPCPVLPAQRCWYCGAPFHSLHEMQAVAQNVGNHLPSAIRWICLDGEACTERLRQQKETKE